MAKAEAERFKEFLNGEPEGVNVKKSYDGIVTILSDSIKKIDQDTPVEDDIFIEAFEEEKEMKKREEQSKSLKKKEEGTQNKEKAEKTGRDHSKKSESPRGRNVNNRDDSHEKGRGLKRRFEELESLTIRQLKEKLMRLEEKEKEIQTERKRINEFIKNSFKDL